MTVDFEDDDPSSYKEDYDVFEERQIDLDSFEEAEGVDEPLDDYLGFIPAEDVFEEREEEL